jgi:hypothetical protein
MQAAEKQMDQSGLKVLMVPRGIPNLEPMKIDMAEVYEAEDRLNEVRHVNPQTAPELSGYFNKVCNTVTKYLSWIEYDILMAEKYLGLAKAQVILDEAPAQFEKVKDKGIKFNEDFRDALVARSVECQKCLDTLNALKAVRALLDNKAKSFVRAYNSCRYLTNTKSQTPVPNFTSGHIGQTYDQPQKNFMGVTRIGGVPMPQGTPNEEDPEGRY